MTTMAVITPTWRRDAGIFDDLHRSVLEFTPPGTVHHIVVPWLHRPLFAKYQGPRCRVWTHQDLIPRRYWRQPGGMWLNLRQPWPPVRGWVMQQAVKIAAAAQADADVALMIDSDVALVRPVKPDHMFADGHPMLYRDDTGVHSGMPRHVLWHDVAHELLGLPPAPEPPLPDYITPVGVWEPATVQAMQRRIEQATGKHWLDAFTGQLHVSEYIVYGVFVDKVLSAGSRPQTVESLCHNRWIREPMTEDSARDFADQLPPCAVAVMISSHSGTTVELRQEAIRQSAQRRQFEVEPE